MLMQSQSNYKVYNLIMIEKGTRPHSIQSQPSKQSSQKKGWVINWKSLW
jgi:hypothetical protein